MDEPNTIGAYLRAARRRRRVSIERASEETRIRSDFLMRMESDDFDFLAPTYVRSFLKSYARYLRTDPEPLLEDFDHKHVSPRMDTAQIVALERRSKRERAATRRSLNSWGVAAVLAAAVIVFLGVLGLAQGDDDPGSGRDREVAGSEEEPSPDAEPSPTPSSGTSPSPTEDPQLASTGIELEVLATSGDCWILATEDGKEATPAAGTTIALGDSLTFSAEEKIFLRLGYPAGVELVVNGQNIGSPGGQDPINITLPDDIDTL